MRKLFGVAALALAALVVVPEAGAQGGGGGGGGRGMGGQRMAEMMFKGITLTDAQKAQVDSIQKKYQAEMPPMTPGQPPAPEAREKRMALMQKQQTDIRAVLTDEQKAVYDKNLEEMRAMGGRRPPQA